MWKDLPRPFFMLAPMADVTDPAYRAVISKYGKPDALYTEFVSADGLFKGGFDALSKDLVYGENEHPIAAQFFSRDAECMQKAARLAEEQGFDAVDINMGCPDRNVCKQGAGAAMIEDPEHARKIIRKTKEATSLPVSVKTRIGYNTNEIETWLPSLLSENPAAVILHARTKKEMSKVPAHWNVIKRAVAIRDELGSDTLIIGNGDAEGLEDAWQKAKETGCDGVMLGRAIYGNPWLFAPLENYIDRSVPPTDNERPPLIERLKVLAEHVEKFEELLPHKSFSIMKKHFKSYLQGEGYDKELLKELMEAKTPEEALKILKK